MILFYSVSTFKAHSQIIDLNSAGDTYGTIDGVYYKDVTNFLNQYLGTWLYSNGTTSLKLMFTKKENVLTTYGNKTFYEDYLVGEYRYIENGLEKVNTLYNLNNNHGNEMYNYNLVSVSCLWFPSIYPQCNECNANEKRLELSLTDPSFLNIKGLTNSFILRAFTEGGVQKLKVWFINETMSGLTFDENNNYIPFNGYNLPFGEYTLIKQ